MIRRRKSLRSSSPPRRRRLTPRRSSRVIDVEYREAVKRLPCRARAMSECWGLVDPDHQGRRGMGQKCSDYECVPLCRGHHDQRAFSQGPFASWSGSRMDQWLYEGIVETQTELLGAPLSNSRRPGGSP